MNLREIGETGLIQRIARRYPSVDTTVVSGIGDDAAALKMSSSKLLLATNDLLIENIHFNLNFTDGYRLGKKSLAINLSDIAAMGGLPRYFLVSLAIPPHLSVDFIDELYRGMMELADTFHLQLIGGDTSASPDALMLSITLLGETNPDTLLTRSGARAGDTLFVTGTLGDSALGLAILKKGKAVKQKSTLFSLISRHLTPYPRVKEGRAIAENHLASAMIDLSDGLLIDLQRVLTLSKVGATIWLSHLPLSKAFREYQRRYRANTIEYALNGGEDYELLFTTPPGREKKLKEVFNKLGVPVSKIGEINNSKKLIVLDQMQRVYPIENPGFDHFKTYNT